MKKKIRPMWIILFIFVCGISGCANSKENSADIISEDGKNSSELESQTEEQIRTTESAVIENDIDLKNEFNDISGCAVLYSVKDKEYLLYNSDMCKQEVSPYSTFKIISTLAGLHNGVIQDETSKMKYTGNQYSISEWNMDLDLKDAFQTSCIWYFRQVVDAVGTDEIEKELNDISYGNCDVSEWEGNNINPQAELNGFWLDSSLKISPFEQVQILTHIFEGNSIYSANEINILKEIMLVDDGTERIYGKTGSGPDGKAWFVGFSETDNNKKYFAVYLNDSTQEKNISGSLAKEIALKIIK